MEVAFLLFLAVYCSTSFIYISRPIGATAYFLLFRSAFAAAPFFHIRGFVGENYFMSALFIYSIQAIFSSMQRAAYLHLNGTFKIFLLFMTMVIVTGIANLAFGSNANQNFEDLAKIVMPTLFYFAFYVGLREEKDISRCSRALLWSAFIPVACALIEVILGVGYNYNVHAFVSGERPAGTIIDPNLFGIFLALTFYVFLPLIIKGGSFKSKLAFTLILFTIVMARNRGTWIALAISMLVTVPIFSRHLKLGKWALTGLIIISLALPVMAARFGELSEVDKYGQVQDTGSGRLKHAANLALEALDSPIIGLGPASSVIYWSNSRGTGQIKLPPHNDYVRVMYEFGIPTFIVYVIALIAQLRFTIIHRRDRLWHYQFMACACQIYIMIISFAQNLLTDTITFCLMFFVMAASHRAAEISKKLDEEDRENASLRNRVQIS